MIRTAELLGTGSVREERAAPVHSRGTPGAFAQLLSREIAQAPSPVRFSNHAQQRLASRGIALSNDDMQRIGGAMDSAASKGARESLVLMDQLAFVVNVPERTVITAMPTDDLQSHVFTNIDSAVVAPSASTQKNTQLDSNFGLVPFAGGLSAAERQTRRIS